MIHDLQYFQLDKTSIQNFWIIKQTGFKNKKNYLKKIQMCLSPHTGTQSEKVLYAGVS